MFAQLSFCYQSKTFVWLAQILYVEPDQNRIVGMPFLDELIKSTFYVFKKKKWRGGSIAHKKQRVKLK